MDKFVPWGITGFLALETAMDTVLWAITIEMIERAMIAAVMWINTRAKTGFAINNAKMDTKLTPILSAENAQINNVRLAYSTTSSQL